MCWDECWDAHATRGRSRSVHVGSPLAEKRDGIGPRRFRSVRIVSRAMPSKCGALTGFRVRIPAPPFLSRRGFRPTEVSEAAFRYWGVLGRAARRAARDSIRLPRLTFPTTVLERPHSISPSAASQVRYALRDVAPRKLDTHLLQAQKHSVSLRLALATRSQEQPCRLSSGQSSRSTAAASGM